MPMFDTSALAQVRARAARRPPSFLDQRIWDDLGDRVALLHRRPRTALLLGPATAAANETAEALGIRLVADADSAPAVDLVLAVRWLETEDDLAPTLAALGALLPPGTPLLGASLGGNSLSALRAALTETDRPSGTVAPRAHPRLEPGALAELFQQSGFVTPVVDVDRVEVRYSLLDRLVADLRDLGATNVLEARSRRYVGKAWRDRLASAFSPGTMERFDILHFSAWTGSR